MSVTDFKGSIKNALTFLRGSNPNETRFLFIYPGNATGDLPHVLPVLAKDPRYRVLIMDGAPAANVAVTNGLNNIGEVMVQQFGIPVDQVARASSDKQISAAIGDAKQAADRMNPGFARVYQLADSTKILRMQFFGDANTDFSNSPKRAAPTNVEPSNPGFVKKVLYGTFHDAPRSQIPISGFYKIIQDAGVSADTMEKPLVVLWGRKSGKPTEGGVHYDLNHSNYGWSQVTAGCLKRGLSVIIAGQIDRAKWLRHDGFQGSHYIGEFYKEPPLTRSMQLCFFDYLRELLEWHGGQKLLHVGMRSGGLDFYGFAGQPILYIATEKMIPDFQTAQPKPVGDERMGSVTQSLSGKEGVSFNRFIAQRQPKRWTTQGDVVMEDPGRKPNLKNMELPPRDAEKGFSPSDLDDLLTRIEILLKL